MLYNIESVTKVAIKRHITIKHTKENSPHAKDGTKWNLKEINEGKGSEEKCHKTNKTRNETGGGDRTKETKTPIQAQYSNEDELEEMLKELENEELKENTKNNRMTEIEENTLEELNEMETEYDNEFILSDNEEDKVEKEKDNKET